MRKLLVGTLAAAVLGSFPLSAEKHGPNPDRTSDDCPCLFEPLQEETDEVKEHDHGDSRPKPNTKEKAFEIDSRLVAETFGWDIEETREHMRNQEKFSIFVARLNEKGSAVFAGSAMARRPGQEATIWIKGEAPPYVKEVAERFTQENEMPVRIVDGMRFSEADQEKRMDQISDELEKRGFSGVGAAMLPGDIIQVSMVASDRFPETPMPKNLEELRLDRDYVDPAAAKLLSDRMDKRGIYFTFTTQRIDVDAHARGGRMVYSGTSQCTSGFSVERISDGLNGIATAAHCTGMSNFDAEPGESDFTLSHRGEHCGSHGDVEWKSSGHWELEEYWANAPATNDLRDVNSVETWYSVNNVYCVYSRMTGTRTCDYVYSTSVKQTGTSGACNGVKADRLVAMDNNNAVPGDSGGPWSYSTEAAGIVKGYKWIWFGYRDTFTKASRFDEALGVRIRTK